MAATQLTILDPKLHDEATSALYQALCEIRCFAGTTNPTMRRYIGALSERAHNLPIWIATGGRSGYSVELVSADVAALKALLAMDPFVAEKERPDLFRGRYHLSHLPDGPFRLTA